MSLDIIETRFREYKPKTKQEEMNVLKEIYQEIALCGLARSDFFKIGAFQGGTCLRILYGLQRFSEDLDFILVKSLPSFEWEKYLKAIDLEFQSFGLKLEVIDRSHAQGIIKRAFLKQTSFGQILQLTHDFLPSDKQKITIKLEIDTNPPEGSNFEIQYLDYPYPFSILVQDLSSLFASKCHSILCRPFTKGRDWFDFLWYVSKKAQINYGFLQNALFQSGPFQNKKLKIDKIWVLKHLENKIHSVDWAMIQEDIKIFLKPENAKFVENWNLEFFQAILKKCDSYLK